MITMTSGTPSPRSWVTRPGSDGWYAAIAAVNAANGDHMAEEEREGLTDFRREASLQLRHDLAVAFAAFEARHFAGVRPVDRDPAAYVQQAERSGRGGRSSGSLGIGSLRGPLAPRARRPGGGPQRAVLAADPVPSVAAKISNTNSRTKPRMACTLVHHRQMLPIWMSSA